MSKTNSRLHSTQSPSPHFTSNIETKKTILALCNLSIHKFTSCKINGKIAFTEKRRSKKKSFQFPYYLVNKYLMRLWMSEMYDKLFSIYKLLNCLVTSFMFQKFQNCFLLFSKYLLEFFFEFLTSNNHFESPL